MFKHIKNKIREIYYKKILKRKYYSPYFIEDCEFIVSSIGRSGSTLVSNLISKGSKRPIRFLRKLSEYSKINKDIYVIKTHCILNDKPKFNYKAIFLYSDIESSIASIYNIDKINPHLKNLGVNFLNRIIFNIIKINNKEEAYIFLIKGDKFNFKRNINSWKNDKNTLFIKFEDLLKNKENKIKEISNFLGVNIPDFEVKKRETSSKNLPKELLDEIKKEY